MHPSSSLPAPFFTPYFPPAQAPAQSGLVVWVLDPYRPFMHAVHTTEPAVEYLPALQAAVQWPVDRPSTAPYLPAAHSLHDG